MCGSHCVIRGAGDAAGDLFAQEAQFREPLLRAGAPGSGADAWVERQPDRVGH